MIHPFRALTLSAALSVMALTAPAQAFDVTNMTEDERAALREEIRSYLLDNPEVIMEAVSVLEQRQAEAQAQGDVELVRVNAQAIFEDGHSWVGGNPDGDITLVEFTDYRCGFCRRAHPEVEQLSGSGRQYPLHPQGISHSGRGIRAVLALCHRGQADRGR